ncbi:MAG: tryptophan synthase subunit alpha [Melioribacteraceae bacterium]|jgi:tryptophan synthase alpha chain|nr:tryptophan synthase subunit alpha [Melioribacteraceae bacterium]
MSKIKSKIEEVNRNGKKALSIFLTSGFPTIEKFINNTNRIIDAGADLIELGMPFSDPLADGGVIQQSSQIALQNGITQKQTFLFAEELKKKNVNTPLILMGYANTIIQYGKEQFEQDAINAGVDGLIIPDVPLEEFDSFFSQFSNKLDKILLTTPTSSKERIITLDNKSTGFLYCVSVSGTTGVRSGFDDKIIENLKATYQTVNNNKMLIGFGISKPENIKQLSPFADGFIVGSAIIKSLQNENIDETIELVKSLSEACSTS